MPALLIGIALIAVSGLAGKRLSALFAAGGAAAGAAVAIETLLRGKTITWSAMWQLPNAMIALRLDPLAAAFLLPIFILGALTAIYGVAYRPAARVRIFLGLLVAAMAMVVVAAHAIVFLLAWETMALAAFFLIAADDAEEQVRSAAWTYLIATHIGTLALFALFVLMRGNRGSFLFGPLHGDAFTAAVMLLLALLGFGFKAGIVPLHFWLPGAHANAPSHISALLSGAMLKAGIYGIVRVAMLLPVPPFWWGATLIAVGAASALTGIALAITQSDMKRALAYSSVENVGVIITAIGLWLLGRAMGVVPLQVLGLAAAIAHVWSHSLFKGLLFLGAGSVVHATGTRRIDALGGLLRSMPVTGNLFFVGAASASVLPGTIAFLSEALLYYGLVSASLYGSVSTLAAAIIALAGALAVAAFIRLAGVIFLGAPRQEMAAHEAPLLMRIPMIALAAAVLAFGLAPSIIARPLETITGSTGLVASFLHRIALPLQLAALAPALLALALVKKTSRAPRRLTWDCGYAKPSPRMQYTSRSFAQWFTAHLMPRFLQPSSQRVALTGLHPTSAAFATTVDEPFADRLLQPLVSRWAARAMRLRWLQQGRLPLYLVYIFVALLASIGWSLVGGQAPSPVQSRAERAATAGAVR